MRSSRYAALLEALPMMPPKGLAKAPRHRRQGGDAADGHGAVAVAGHACAEQGLPGARRGKAPGHGGDWFFGTAVVCSAASNVYGASVARNSAAPRVCRSKKSAIQPPLLLQQPIHGQGWKSVRPRTHQQHFVGQSRGGRGIYVDQHHVGAVLLAARTLSGRGSRWLSRCCPQIIM